jgi:hypothetical protein
LILWVIRVIERVVGVVSSVEDYEKRCLRLDEANERIRKENNDLKASLKSATESLENETRIRKEYESCIIRELKVQRAEALRWKQRALRAGWRWNYIDSWRSRKR